MVQELVQEQPQIGVNRVVGIESADVFIGSFLSQSAVALGISEPQLTTAPHKTIGSPHAGEIHAAKEILQIPTPILTRWRMDKFPGYTPHLQKIKNESRPNSHH